MHARRLRWDIVALAFAVGGGCALTLSNLGPLSGYEPALTCSGQSAPLHRVELVFGLSRKGLADIDDAGWQSFLDREITPRFPDGLTVIDARGQWRTADGEIVREPARLLLVWAKPASDLAPRIEAIRIGWKRDHGQESVVRAERRECVSF